jgi:ABC-type phosphate transport system substrate-binding protein
MRTSIAIATFLVVAAGVTSAAALSNIHLKGSDTLYEVTSDVLAVCPGATGLVYDGTGSGAGESGLKAGTQTIAPMSRFLSGSAICTLSGAAGSPSTSSALVIGLDGISVVGSAAAAGAATCNGATADCDPTTEPNVGAAINTTVTLSAGTYTFASWRDVLRVVFAGFDHDAGSDITKRNCNSELRQAVVNNWSNFFQSKCSGGNCTQLRHAFRRDDSSGTTDTFTSLLGLPTASVSANTSPFCNALQTADVLSAGVNRLPADFQDNDPIRRACAGTNGGTNPSITVGHEQVCGRKGDLGFVVPVYPTDFLTPAEAFPTSPCTTNTIFGTAPRVIAGGGTAAGTGRCPNGDIPVFINQCLVPVDANGSAACLAGKSSKPAFVFDNTAVDGVAPSGADGRAYNQNLFKADGTYQVDKKTPSRQIAGAYYRIHSTRTLNTPDSSVSACKHQDATAQIGCLVQASPCSIGYAGKEATNGPEGGAVAIKIKALEPTTACIQSFSYPLTRKLYLSTTAGFANVTGQELALAQCEATPATINASLSAHGFVSLPATVPGGGVYCEDFNEQALCGAASNADGCAANAGVSLPIAKTVCGNGVKEALEECDNGATNGAAPAECSTACRLNN